MTQLTQTNSETGAGSATTSLLAALKARLGSQDNSVSGLFSSLLKATEASLPQVKAVAPSETIATCPTTDTTQKQIVSTDQADRSSDATDQKTVLSGAQNKPSDSKTSTAKQDKKEAKADDVQQQAAANDDTQDEQTGKAQEIVALVAVKAKSVTQKTDDAVSQTDDAASDDDATDNDLTQILAAIVPLAEKVRAEKTATDETVDAGKTDVSMDDMIAALESEVRTLASLRKTKGDQTTEQTKASSSSASETAQTTATDATKTDGVNAPSLADLLGAKEETTATPKLSADAVIAKITGDKDERTTTLAPTTATESKPIETIGLSAKQESAAPIVPAVSVASAGAAVVVSETASAIESSVQSIGAAKATQVTMPMAEGVKTAGSYDFASQLSATRATKGGSVGLPEAVEQVALQLHKSVKDGEDQITIQLRPAELGKIEVKLSFDSEKNVTGTVIADNQTTLTMLQKDSSSLVRALQDAGLQANSGSLQFNLRGDGQQNQFSQNQPGSSSSSSDNDLSGLASIEDVAAASAVETYYITPGRVNLSV